MAIKKKQRAALYQWLFVVLVVALVAFILAGKTKAEKVVEQASYQAPEVLNPHQEQLFMLDQRYPSLNTQVKLIVDVSEQMMYHYRDNQLIHAYPVSTASKGVGSKSGSGKTPLGAHRISHRFGDGAPLGTIFKARQNTGKIAKIIKEPIDIPSDAVTTRILWLDGLEPKRNKGGNVDSKRRYIYIHGTPEEGLIGRPASHGCVRMYNEDVVAVYQQSPVNSLVYIQE